MWLVLLFGVIGYLFKKFGYPLSPLVVAIVLGEETESSFRRSSILSQGNPAIFVTRPVSLALLLIALCQFLLPLVAPAIKKWHRLDASRPPLAKGTGFEPSSADPAAKMTRDR